MNQVTHSDESGQGTPIAKANGGVKHVSQKELRSCEESSQWESTSHFADDLDAEESAAVAALLFRKGLLSQKNGQED